MSERKNHKIGECAGCRKQLTEGMTLRYQGKTWCEDCAMEVRNSRGRKTHWQYLKSIKTDYMRPARRTVSRKTQGPERSEQGED